MALLYRAVDKEGYTIDFLLTAKRDKKADLRFFNQPIDRNGKPSLINIDRCGANKAGIKTLISAASRSNNAKFLNNTVEKHHRFVEWKTKLVLGFKNFYAAQKTLASIELIRTLKKDQMKNT